MTNDCWNHIMIVCDPTDQPSCDQLRQFIIDELNQIYQNDDVFDDKIRIHKQHHSYILFTLWSRWYPDFEWLDGLLDKYPALWIKNEWYEEGGQAGVWVGRIVEEQKEIRHFDWDDICIDHPVFEDTSNH
jgi:hypothetical protein